MDLKKQILSALGLDEEKVSLGWQGKSEEQIKSSMAIASISVMCMFVLIFLSFIYKLIYWLL